MNNIFFIFSSLIYPLEMVIFHSYVYSGTLKLKNAILETSLCQKKTQISKKWCQGLFALVFSSFPSLMGKEIRDNFERKRKPVLRCLGDWVFTKPCKHEVNCNFCCICASNRVIFWLLFFYVFWVPLWEENTLHGENFPCLLLPKICILYGNTVFWCIDALKLRMSPGRHSKIP